MMRLRSANSVLFLVLAGFGAKSALAQTLTTLYTFSGNPATDGGEPIAQLVRDSAGNLYGTTFEGGGSCRRDHFGCGTVFKLDTANNETVLLGFPSTGKGDMPEALIRDTAGNLYGITYVGGGKNLGTVFKLG